MNGPGETDDADLGLWCAPTFVNLKRGEEDLGAYPYDEVLGRLKTELDTLIAERAGASVAAVSKLRSEAVQSYFFVARTPST